MMNKKLQAVLGVIFLACSASGQTTVPGQEKDTTGNIVPRTYFTPIIKVASTFLNYGDDNSSVADYKKQDVGLLAGASVQIGLTSNFSLLSELYYMRKGGKLKANNPLTSEKTTYRFHTLELPLLARIHLGKVHLNAGPSIAYTLSGTEKTEAQSKSMTFDQSGEGFRRFDAGIQVGGGYTLPMANKYFLLDIRYLHGLTNVSNVHQVYNRGIVASLIVLKPAKAKRSEKG